MQNLIITGTIGLDTIQTPFGKVEEALGGAAVYASYAASFFTKPGMVSIAGTDFPKQYEKLLSDRGIDLAGVARKGKNFRWSGMYEFDMNEAKTLKTELNALLEFKPVLPEQYKAAPFAFIGNIDPVLQIEVIRQLKDPRFIALDTMNFWIESKKEQLLDAISQVNLFLCNDAEARQLFETPNLVLAARKALKLGPQAVIFKKGEHGALLFTEDSHFSAMGYPLEMVKDPTGCGDCFGGSIMGYLAKANDTSEKNIRKAMVYGSAIASFNAEDFGLGRLKQITLADIEQRVKEFRMMQEF